jgi:hypothetical protein
MGKASCAACLYLRCVQGWSWCGTHQQDTGSFAVTATATWFRGCLNSLHSQSLGPNNPLLSHVGWQAIAGDCSAIGKEKAVLGCSCYRLADKRRSNCITQQVAVLKRTEVNWQLQQQARLLDRAEVQGCGAGQQPKAKAQGLLGQSQQHEGGTPRAFSQLMKLVKSLNIIKHPLFCTQGLCSEPQ